METKRVPVDHVIDPDNVRTVLVNGPIKIERVNNLAFFTFCEVRPRVERATDGTTQIEIAVVSRLAMDALVLRQFLDAIQRFSVANVQPAGHG